MLYDIFNDTPVFLEQGLSSVVSELTPASANTSVYELHLQILNLGSLLIPKTETDTKAGAPVDPNVTGCSMVGGKPDNSGLRKCSYNDNKEMFTSQANRLPHIIEERGSSFERFDFTANGVVDSTLGCPTHSNFTQAGVTGTY